MVTMANAQPVMVVRFATVDDAGSIARLLDDLGYPTAVGAVPGRIARMAAEPGQHLFLAEVHGAVVGMATVVIRHVINNDAPFARLALIVVSDEWRSRGIGQALVERAEEVARAAGCNLIDVTSAERRERAHQFYRRLGYVELPRRFIKHL